MSTVFWSLPAVCWNLALVLDRLFPRGSHTASTDARARHPAVVVVVRIGRDRPRRSLDSRVAVHDDRNFVGDATAIAHVCVTMASEGVEPSWASAARWLRISA